MAPTRWGIASAGVISHDFAMAVQILPATDHKVVAVAARNLDKAKEFAKKLNIPKAYGSYDELSKDPEIDIVYIGSIHTQHVPLAKMMMAQGKHVLSEKPLSVNVESTQQCIDFAREKKLFMMEGFWSRFFPVWEKVRSTLKSGSLGEVKVLTVNFGYPITHKERIADPKLGGGAMLDLGGYITMVAEMIMGGNPEKIVASSTKQASGVDESTVVVLTYPGNRIAVLTCYAACMLKNNVVINCEKGIIEIPNFFWCPTDVTINGENLRYALPADPTPFNLDNSSGFAYQIQHVRERLLAGDLESPIMPHESTLNISRIIQEALRQAGISYETPV